MSITYPKVSIRPYVEATPNMGLEKHQQVLFDGAKHTIEMAAVEEGDTVRYLTGLNPFAPEIELAVKDEREAKIEEIKRIVIHAEAKLGGNVIKSDDPDWWSKVKRVKPDNINFWSNSDMKLVLTNEVFYLDPSKNVIDLLIYISIKAGGFPEIATTLTDARNRVRAPKFYLDELEETASIETEHLKLRDQAGSLLMGMYSKNSSKFMYVCKVIDPLPSQYKKSTPVDVMYLNMSNFLEGKSFEKNKTRAVKQFIETADLDMETLKLRAIVKEATFYKYISLKGDGMIYDMESNTAMGKNPVAVVEFLKNPLNEDTFKRLLNKVEQHWKQ